MTDAVPLLDAAAAASGDEAAVAAGDSWAGLMERAAGHLARGVLELAGFGYGLRVAVLVGKGDNGGDGWVAARRLRERGAQARVVSAPPLDAPLSAQAAAGRDRWRAAGGWCRGDNGELEATLAWADVAVDALLGTGSSGAPRGAVGDAANALGRAHAAGLPVVAADVPSGVSADDGTVPEGAVRADLTVTFGGVKRGLLLHPGAARAGRVIVGDLGPRYRPPAGDWTALTARGAAPALREADDEKRSRGVVQLVAGAVGAAGAAVLATRGALRMGAGLTTLACPAHVQRVIAPVVPPAMTRPLAHAGQHVSPEAAGQLQLAGVDAVGAGPGLGHGPGTRAVVDRLLREAPRVVLDADAINVFRDDAAALADHAGELVLTPHRRELARITDAADGEDAWRRRVELVPRLAASLRATVVAKGPGTIVAAPDGRVWVTPTGSPALAVGGTGDVLCGMVTAAVAAVEPGGDVPLAVARTVWLHGLAGELLGRRTADRADAERLAEVLPEALATAVELAAVEPTYPFDPSVARGASS